MLLTNISIGRAGREYWSVRIRITLLSELICWHWKPLCHDGRDGLIFCKTQNGKNQRWGIPNDKVLLMLTLILETASSACIILVALVGCPSHTSWVEPR